MMCWTHMYVIRGSTDAVCEDVAYFHTGFRMIDYSSQLGAALLGTLSDSDID